MHNSHLRDHPLVKSCFFAANQPQRTGRGSSGEVKRAEIYGLDTSARPNYTIHGPSQVLNSLR